MRILDLGAHDGFVSAYIADRLDESIVRVDGVELNSHGVEVANRRLGSRGIPGEFKRGRAEDAPTLFEPGSYDAVVAFELIEHVPDVELFLDACEAMCAPGGRVYISTPDGTFGEGQNPHHLRVYRTIDLIDILRRRGDVQNMIVGPDTVIVTAYTPWSAMPETPHGRGDVAIYTGPGWKPWSPLDAEQPGGLGGSETAAAKLAEELQDLGWTVTVYGEVESGCFGQVVYRHHSAFDPMVERAAVIASRAPFLADRPIAARRKLLWMHDTDYGPAVTEQRAGRFDHVLTLSRWHTEHVQRMYPFLSNVRQIANGITPAYFTDGQDIPRFNNRAIFSSSPDRGLDLLLEWWPQVRFHDPDAELLFCYADVYAAVASSGQRPEVAAHHAKIQQLEEQPGVRNLGALSQPDLAKIMRSCGVWLHPSWNSPSGRAFHETFCIGAVEAAAAGCHLVVSPNGALPERMGTAQSWQVVGNPDERPDADEWVQAIVEGMQTAGRNGIGQSPEALQQSWAAFAADVSALIEQ